MGSGHHLFVGIGCHLWVVIFICGQPSLVLAGHGVGAGHWHLWAVHTKKGRSYQCPPNSCRNPVIPAESGGIQWNEIWQDGLLFFAFWWNLGIPELRLECSTEFTGMECNGTESGCLVNTLFGIHCLFVAHLLTNKHNVLPFPPPTMVHRPHC